jgi:hypothetical protein
MCLQKLGINSDSKVSSAPTIEGVLTSVGGSRSFYQFERRSKSPTRSIILEGMKEASLHNSYENCSVNRTDRSFMCSHEGEKHIQCETQPVPETRSETNAPDANIVDGAICLITYLRIRVQKYTTPISILRISMIPKSAQAQKNCECQFGNVDIPVPELDDQCRNWIGAEMGSNIYKLVRGL